MDIKPKNYSDRKKRVKWTPEAVRFLLKLWKEILPKMRNTKRTSHIYTEMSTQMIKGGFNFNAREVTVKLHNLTNKYKEERKKVKKGTAFENDWRYYKELDYLLGSRISYETFISKCTCDPLNESNEESRISGENARTEDADLKTNFEESSFHPESDASESADIDRQSNCSSSDMYACNDQSENEVVLISETSVSKQRGETNPKSADNSTFRIIADGGLPSDKDTSSRNGIWPTFVPKKLSKTSMTENPNALSLNLAKWELVQLQKAKVEQEIEYQRQEYEQKRREHSLRLSHMEEEHELRMMSLRNDLKMSLKHQKNLII
ncbi:uncharacterized protein LOC129244740 [Anastrepha obliqua]|uniref:uncharacterized protein LOC129244740 n=1 Tax=Anastrepha obliqua TaxID=95512 RepID=UPI00240A060F|nr:uncharacterized protein LOC129244740 [Anastrepha obliqua]